MPDFTLTQVSGAGASLVLTGNGQSLIGQVGPQGPPSILVLHFDDPIPVGTKPGTVIFRK